MKEFYWKVLNDSIRGYVQNVTPLTERHAFPRESAVGNALEADMAINGNGGMSGNGETGHGFEWKVLQRGRQHQNQLDFVRTMEQKSVVFLEKQRGNRVSE